MLQALKNLLPEIRTPTKISVPTAGEIYAELEATKFTPDVMYLEQFEWQLYFAMDTTKKDHPRHDLLGEAEYKFPAFTQKNFHFWKPPEPWHKPVAMDLRHEENVIRGLPPVAKIKGEVYLIRPQRFLELDRYHQNTVEYTRRRVRLIVPYRKVLWLKDHHLDPAFGVTTAVNRLNYQGKSVKTTQEFVAIIRAWMYIGSPTYWDPLISLFDYTPIEAFYGKNRRWCEQYYSVRRPPLSV